MMASNYRLCCNSDATTDGAELVFIRPATATKTIMLTDEMKNIRLNTWPPMPHRPRRSSKRFVTWPRN